MDIKSSFVISFILLFTIMPIGLAHNPPINAKVFFNSLDDGALVTSPVRLKFGIKGYGITPAGTKDKIRHSAGHHHLLLDAPGLPDLDKPIPRNNQHLHFDQGETETVLDLLPGKHTLQLLLGDEDHECLDPSLFSDKITITVQ